MTRTRPSLFSLVMALPLLLWQLAFFAFPLLFLVAISFWTVRNFQMTPDLNFANWERILTRNTFWDAYARTAMLATASAALTSLIAFPAAYAISFKLTDRAKQWLIFVLIIPFFTSYLVRIYALQVFLSDAGIVNAALGMVGLGPVGMLNTTFGTLVGMVTLCLPLVILLQVFSLNFVNRDLVEAAHNLRCGRLRTVLAVIVPSARVGLVIAALFAFILSLGDFVSPLYLGGGNPPTLSIMITDITKSGQQWPRAAVVALMMIGTLLSVAFAAIAYAYKERGK
jgi:spermidine/putrescine transport system permease protein/putrescine transport system permease protein